MGDFSVVCLGFRGMVYGMTGAFTTGYGTA